MAKKLTFSQQNVNFLDITFEPAVRLSPNFENEKICTLHDVFARGGIHKGRPRSRGGRGVAKIGQTRTRGGGGLAKVDVLFNLLVLEGQKILKQPP